MTSFTFQEVCDNCHKTIAAYKTAEGLIKYKCPYCGTKTVKRRISRTCITKEIHFPRQSRKEKI